MYYLQDRIKKYAGKKGLSDIHIRATHPPALRINGEIIILDELPVALEELQQFFSLQLSSNQVKQWEDNRYLDSDIEIGESRFRANFYYADNKPAIVLRVIAKQVPTMDALGLPSNVKKYLSSHSGLILVAGATGSGKSTSLAAIANHIITTQSVHILTIEDPIEFKLNASHSVISQRQIGSDAKCFSSAIRSALREDPDVILIGELRDAETIALALSAAELGHLVLATLHASDCVSTITRIINSFQAQYRELICSQLADSLQLIIGQRLMRVNSDASRTAAYEVMIANQAVRNLIRTNKIFQLPSVMETSREHGMITMNDAIARLDSARVETSARA